MALGSDEHAVVERQRLAEHLRGLVRDPRISEAFGRVPRHRFVPAGDRAHAYEDRALELCEEQTISQPTMIALMLDALKCAPGDHALEVGSGSGYAAALLAELVGQVDAVEIRPGLAESARRVLAELGVRNVRVHVGDGRLGWPAHAPYQRILVSAATSDVPQALLDQLGTGGRIAVPLGDDLGQHLTILERNSNGSLSRETSVPCLFVPLVAGAPPTPSPRSAW